MVPRRLLSALPSLIEVQNGVPSKFEGALLSVLYEDAIRRDSRPESQSAPALFPLSVPAVEYIFDPLSVDRGHIHETDVSPWVSNACYPWAMIFPATQIVSLLGTSCWRWAPI